MFVNKVFVIATLAISVLAAPAYVELEAREPGIKSAFLSLKHKIDHKIEEGQAKGLLKGANKNIGKDSAKLHASITTVNGRPVVQVSSVGGAAITLATGRHGVKTTWAGHQWKVATATPSSSSSSPSASVTKRSDDLEARRIHLFHTHKKSKAQHMADHANKVIGKKHTAQVHATIATVSGQEVVQVTSVGGPAITLATKGGVKTKFAGHQWHVVTAAPSSSSSSSSSSATPTQSKRSIDEYIEARELEARQHTNGAVLSFGLKPILTAMAGVLGSIATGAMVVL